MFLEFFVAIADVPKPFLAGLAESDAGRITRVLARRRLRIADELARDCDRERAAVEWEALKRVGELGVRDEGRVGLASYGVNLSTSLDLSHSRRLEEAGRIATGISAKTNRRNNLAAPLRIQLRLVNS